MKGLFYGKTVGELREKLFIAMEEENGEFISDKNVWRFITYPNHIPLFEESYGIRNRISYMVDYMITTAKEAKALASKYDGKYEDQYYGDGYQLRFADIDHALKFILDLSKF